MVGETEADEVEAMPMGLPSKMIVQRMHDYLISCLPNADEGALYEVALNMWRISRGA